MNLRDDRSPAGDPSERQFVPAVTDLGDADEDLLSTPLAAVLDTLPAAAFLHNAEGQIVRANAQARILIALDALPGVSALSPDEWTPLLAPRRPDGRPLPREEWYITRLLAGETISTDAPLEVWGRMSDGSERVVIFTGAPVRDADGQVIGALALARDVTHERRDERERTLNAAELVAMLETIPDAVAVYSADGRVLQTNAAYRALFALDAHEDFFAHTVAERREMLMVRDSEGHRISEQSSAFSRVLRGETLTGESAVDLWVRNARGRDVLLSVTGSPIRDEHGRVEKAVLVYRDVTERRQLEHQLAERATELEAIFENMSDSVVVYDAEGRIRRFNTAARSLFQRAVETEQHSLPLGERVGLGVLRDSSGSPLPIERTPAYRLLHGETLRDLPEQDLRVDLLDGSHRRLRVTGAPLLDADSHVIGGVAVFRDATERIALERRTRDALEALLEMAQTLVDLPSAVGQEADAVREPSDREPSDEVRRNAIAHRIAVLTCGVLGCTRVGVTAVDPETQIMRAIAVVGLPPDVEARWWDEQRALEAQGVRLGDGADPEQIERFRGGEIFVIDMREPPYNELPNPYGVTTTLAAPMRVGNQIVGMLTLDFGGSPHAFTMEEIELAGAVAQLGAVVIERERLLREREEARASVLALAEANRRMDEFLSLASHELLTPLTTIKVNIQLLGRRTIRLVTDPVPEETLRATAQQLHTLIERTETSVVRQERLIDELLDTSRIQRGKLEMRPEPADLASIVVEAVDEQRLQQPERTIELERPRGSLPVIADAMRIGQVISNYLTNALKYSPSDCPVTVAVRKEGRHARVEVRDSGPGIPVEERPRIWERFHRVPGIQVVSGSGVGLGLGLYLSRSIVELHNGHVGVESNEGGGAVFWFTLPLAPSKTKRT